MVINNQLLPRLCITVTRLATEGTLKINVEVNVRHKKNTN